MEKNEDVVEGTEGVTENTAEKPIIDKYVLVDKSGVVYTFNSWAEMDTARADFNEDKP